ncbi:hypothetical protein Tco_0494315 [Tanacetum coccineum]
MDAKCGLEWQWFEVRGRRAVMGDRREACGLLLTQKAEESLSRGERDQLTFSWARCGAPGARGGYEEGCDGDVVVNFTLIGLSLCYACKFLIINTDYSTTHIDIDDYTPVSMSDASYEIEELKMYEQSVGGLVRLGKKWNINVSKSSKPKESVSEKVHTGESSKPFLRRVYQFTTYSLQKDRKFSKKFQSFEIFFPPKGFKTRASNAKNQSFETSHSCFTPVKQVWRTIKESQTFEASTSQQSFKTSTLKGKNRVFVTPHSRFTPVKQVWRPKQSHSKSFKYSKSEMLSMQNKNDFASTINKKGRFSNDAKTNFRNVSSNDNIKWKSSSSTRFKTSHETPSFKNQWKIKRNFKSPLIPRELFSNETPISSSRWNSTSLHRLDTTL